MGLVTGLRGELGHRRGRRQDSAESLPLPAEKHKDVSTSFQNTELLNNTVKILPTCVCAHVATRGGLFLLTEELFVLVRGNIIRWEELITEGQVKCAVILACTFFWRSVLTSNTASILLRKNIL